MTSDPLCKLPPPPPAGCCDEPTPPLAAPVTPYNSPGLSAIRYRIGTFTTFRRAMLDDVPLVKVPKDTRVEPPRDRPNPFAKWHEGMQGDYHTTLIELWAYLADVLTFYQERIANEAFVSTATQRDSLRRLVELIGYRPQPGSAATALLAFTIENEKKVTIPPGFRAGSKAKPGKQAAVFETETGVVAYGQLSAIPLSTVAPINQFARLSDYGLLLGVGSVTSAGVAAANIYGSAGATYLQTFLLDSAIESVVSAEPTASIATSSISSSAARSAAKASPLVASSGFAVSNINAQILVRSQFGSLYVSNDTRQVVLKGTNTRLAVGDFVLVVENDDDSDAKGTLRRISKVKAEKETSTTTIRWQEESGVSYANASLYALRVTASPFGSNAPIWKTLPATLTTPDDQHPHPPFEHDWDSDASAEFFVAAQGQLFLDSTYDDVNGTPESPGWAVTVTDDVSGTPPASVNRSDGKMNSVFKVIDASPVNNSGYAMTTKVTRLRLNNAIASRIFPIRTTAVLAGNEKLELQNNLPLPDPLSGAKLILSGLYPQLVAGQTVILQGNIYDSAAGEVTDVVNAESGVLAEAPVIDAENNITTVTLKKALEKSYARSGAVLFANVIEATQGETVRDEILGSGDGSEFQSFKLKKNPLSYLPADDAEGLSAVESSLLVTVNGVRWEEQRTLFESAANGQDYTVSQDDDEKSSVSFGDGSFGARPPTGRDNIHARYRKGLGTSGNVESGGVQQLLDNLTGVKKVANPQSAFGGADRESLDQVRINAPASIRTFGRAVSAADYASLALSYPGVAKASASYVTRDAVTLKSLAHPYIQLVIATADQKPLSEQLTFALKLRSFLDQRRDPNISLRITDFIPVFIDVSASIEIEDRFPHQGTIAKVQSVLNPIVNPDNTAGFFAFERLRFGESIHLSAVYAEIQSVPGVKDARISTLRRLPGGGNQVLDSIFIRPNELAVIRNDPDNLGEGTLTLTGTGGFVDT